MGTPRIDKLDTNYIINGDYKYFQRALTSGGLGLINTPVYSSADRFLLEFTETLTGGTFDRVIDSPNGSTKYAGSFIINTPTSTNILRKSQRIESIFAVDLSNTKLSYKLSYKTDSAQQIRVIMRVPTLEDNYASSVEFFNQVFTVTNDSAWHDLIIENIASPLTLNGVEVVVEGTNWVSLNVNSFLSFAQEKLSIGTTVQDFSLMGRNSVEELGLCQRYFEKSYELDTPLGTITGVGNYHVDSFNNNAINLWANIDFKVNKRAVPIWQIYDPVNGTTGLAFKGSGPIISHVGGGDIGVSAVSLGFNNVGNQGLLLHYSFDAEI